MCRGRGLWSIGSKPPLPGRPIPTPFRHTITHTYTPCLPTLSRRVHNAIYINIRGWRGGREISALPAARKRNSCLPTRSRKTIGLSIHLRCIEVAKILLFFPCERVYTGCSGFAPFFFFGLNTTWIIFKRRFQMFFMTFSPRSNPFPTERR